MTTPPKYLLLAVAILGSACTGNTGTTDPSDETDVEVGYIGGWPVNPDKDALGTGPFDGAMFKETQLPRLSLEDQYGEMVDLYDFSGPPGVVVIESVSKDYEGCREMSALLAGQDSELANDEPGRAQIREIVSDGKIWWIRAMAGNVGSGDIQNWASWYPAPQSPVLLDENGHLAQMFVRYWGATRTGGYPAITVVDRATMKVVAEPDDSLRNLDELVRTYGD